ncbi:MAG: DciA family protein [Candidatus Ratteibacteria bacterium]
MEKISNIVRKVIKEVKDISEKNRGIDISVLWTRLIDERLKGKCYVLFERERNLYVKVENGCFLSLLRMQKKQLLNKLKEYGFNYIDIKFLI